MISTNNETKSAIVTGGTTGIGLAMKTLLEQNSWSVLSLGRSDFDMRNPNGFSEWISTRNVPAPNLLICNAGINVPQSIEEQSEIHFQEINQANFLSHKSMIKHFIPKMIQEEKEGRVVFISSTFASRSKFGRSAYSSSKAAMESFIRSCAIEYAKNGILFNSIAPGFIDTQLTRKNNTDDEIQEITKRIPIHRLGLPVEIARLALFLGSSLNGYITGQTINVDGGYSIT
jgi:NAD(P)-dependent dehydrogenase (short-subunit alcohol dehydrogenase family)